MSGNGTCTKFPLVKKKKDGKKKKMNERKKRTF